MRQILLSNASVLNEAGRYSKADLLIVDGKISQLGDRRQWGKLIDVHEVNAYDQLVTPSFVDVHVHLREPGQTHKETISSGTAAAARGGFGVIACMPNTKPTLDSVGVVTELREKLKKESKVDTRIVAAITEGQKGDRLTDFEALKELGVIGFSDDGRGVQNPKIMRDALRLAARLNLPILAHCEDETLSKPGVVHEGQFALDHCLCGIPALAESVHVARDLLLAEEFNTHYHVCHISCEQSVRLVREAKRRGQNVSCEVTPHHLLLADENIPGLNPNFKMNPPLRTRRDVEALIEGLNDGTIDCIATDHAPHSQSEKDLGMEKAPFGVVGLETAFALLYTHLVKQNKLSLQRLIDAMSARPANLFGLPSSLLEVGAYANLCLLDLESTRPVARDSFRSLSQNTPFEGWALHGWPTMTMAQGNIVFMEERGA